MCRNKLIFDICSIDFIEILPKKSIYSFLNGDPSIVFIIYCFSFKSSKNFSIFSNRYLQWISNPFEMVCSTRETRP
jgi:hypothetical protein